MNNYYSGQGTLYVADRQADGLPEGLVSVGNVPTLEISIETTKFEHKESESGNRLLDLTLIQETKGNFNMVLESISPENMAMAFFGTLTTETGATVASEIVTMTTKGVRYILANVNLDVGTPVTLADGVAAPLTENTDFVVDYSTGAIEILEAYAGTMPDDFDAGYDFLDHYKVAAFTQTSVIKYMRFEGIDTVDGNEVIVDIFNGEIDPAQNFGLINDELGQLTITGTMLADPLALAREGSSFFIERRTDTVTP